MTPSGESYMVWARRSTEPEAIVRATLAHLPYAEAEALHIARASGHDGAMSVYVTNQDGQVFWAAGEKWSELADAGVELEHGGRVISVA